jgi:hypothetical protein
LIATSAASVMSGFRRLEAAPRHSISPNEAGFAIQADLPLRGLAWPLI